jgi:hypothetical protein
MKKGLMLGISVFFLVIICTPYTSHAVPSYARQVQKPCTACHTIWPNLNQYGRQFKVKAYTDVSEKWEMINKDNMNLTTIFPFSARILYFPENRTETNNPQFAQSSTNVDSVQLFIASRAYDYAGVFASAEWSPDTDTIGVPTAKLAFQYPLGEGNTIGLVAFKGLSSSADPFNSLGGRDRSLTWGDESTPLILTSGWTLDFFSEGNVGTVVHGYFLGNRLYAAVGALRGGLSADASGGFVLNVDPTTPSSVASSDPNDLYSRIAWDQKLSNGAITFGAAYYDGKQRILATPGPVFPYDSKVKRTYVDLSLEQNYGEDHMFEVQALYGGGKETNAFGGGEERKFDGYYVEGSYFYDRKIGFVAAINNIKFKDVLASDIAISPNFGVDKVDSWLVSLNFLPWLNTKFALQYVDSKTTSIDPTVPDVTNKTTRIVMDVAF